MHWNHRVIEKNGEFFFAEVYYENNKPIGWGEGFNPMGETLEELKEELDLQTERLLTALTKPILVVDSEDKFVREKPCQSSTQSSTG